jgi:hypothetical protein
MDFNDLFARLFIYDLIVKIVTAVISWLRSALRDFRG